MKRKKVRVYHGMKGERIKVYENSEGAKNLKSPMPLTSFARKRTKYFKGHACSYDDQQRKDMLFAAVFCFAIALGCLLIVLNT